MDDPDFINDVCCFLDLNLPTTPATYLQASWWWWCLWPVCGIGCVGGCCCSLGGHPWCHISSNSCWISITKIIFNAPFHFKVETAKHLSLNIQFLNKFSVAMPCPSASYKGDLMRDNRESKTGCLTLVNGNPSWLRDAYGYSQNSGVHKHWTLWPSPNNGMDSNQKWS